MTALLGKSVALSVSDAPDRARLGFPEREINRALFSICTVMVRSGAKIVYGGNLDPNGLTFKMFEHLTSVYVTDFKIPFIHIIPEPVFRKVCFDSLVDSLHKGASVVKTQVHINGNLVPLRAVENNLRIGKGASDNRLGSDSEFRSWLKTHPKLDTISAFSAARKAMTSISNARIVIGGKMGLLNNPRDTYKGAMPGIVEEMLLALAAGLPCVPLGAFGGAARDIAIALELLDSTKRVPRAEQSQTYARCLDQVATYRDKIPINFRPALKSLADDDRGEPMAYNIVALLERWLA